MIPLSNRHTVWLLRSVPNFLWPVRVWLTRKSLLKVGRRFRFGPNCQFSDAKLITIGDNVFFGDGCVIGCTVPVTIGSDVMFGPEVMIRGGDHNFSKVGSRMSVVKEGGRNEPVVLEDDIWVGARATILKGVTIREGAVIGALSLVNRDVLPYTINVGNPCRVVRSRFTSGELAEHLRAVGSKYSFEEVSRMYEAGGVKWRNESRQ